MFNGQTDGWLYLQAVSPEKGTPENKIQGNMLLLSRFRFGFAIYPFNIREYLQLDSEIIYAAVLACNFDVDNIFHLKI